MEDPNHDYCLSGFIGGKLGGINLVTWHIDIKHQRQTLKLRTDKVPCTVRIGDVTSLCEPSHSLRDMGHGSKSFVIV